MHELQTTGATRDEPEVHAVGGDCRRGWHEPRGRLVQLRVLNVRLALRARRRDSTDPGIWRPKTDFFLRAESLFTAATYLEELAKQPAGNPFTAYGGISLHEQSHGESFLAWMIHRFGAEGFHLLDEPEAALSSQNCLTCLRRIHSRARARRVAIHHRYALAAHPRLSRGDDLHVQRDRAVGSRLRRRRPVSPHPQLPRRTRALPAPLAQRLTIGTSRFSRPLSVRQLRRAQVQHLMASWGDRCVR